MLLEARTVWVLIGRQFPALGNRSSWLQNAWSFDHDCLFSWPDLRNLFAYWCYSPWSFSEPIVLGKFLYDCLPWIRVKKSPPRCESRQSFLVLIHNELFWYERHRCRVVDTFQMYAPLHTNSRIRTLTASLLCPFSLEVEHPFEASFLFDLFWFVERLGYISRTFLLVPW